MYYKTEVAKVAPVLFPYCSTYDIHHDKYLESFRAPGIISRTQAAKSKIIEKRE